MSLKIGKARFGGGTQRKYFKLKEGDQAFRILPPLGDLADSGRWSVFYNVHYGYKTTDGKQKPFVSPEVKNRKNGMIEVADAAKERIETLKAELEKAKKSGNKAAVDLLNVLVGPTGMYNLDNNHYLNVLDSQGNIGVLKLRHKAKLALEAQIKNLHAQSVDPLSVEDGRFFVFNRTGMGRDTTFAVSILKEKLNVPGVGSVERDVVHKLDNDTLNRLETEAAQLDKLFKRLTSEEVKSVVDSSELKTGTSPYLDKIFNKSNVSEDTTDDTDTPDVTEEVAAAPPTPTPTARVALVTPKAAPVKTTAQSITEQSNEDFMASLEAL